MSDTEESEPSPELDALDQMFVIPSPSINLAEPQPSCSKTDKKTEPLRVDPGANEAVLPPSPELSPFRPFSKPILPPIAPSGAIRDSIQDEENHKESPKGAAKGAKLKSPNSRPRKRKSKEQKDGPEGEDTKKCPRRKRRSKEEAESKEEDDGEEKKKKRRDRGNGTSIICQLLNASGEPGCKQRAILGYRFCIRHILNDPESPYIQCAHTRRPKSKSEPASRCTNAIKKESNQTYCSTHLIMAGLKEVKRKASVAGIEEPSNDGGSPPVSDGPSSTTAPDSKRETKKVPSSLPPSSVPPKPDSHLIKALTSPQAPPRSIEQAHPLLRSVLETKVEPRLLSQRYLAAPAPQPPTPTIDEVKKEASEKETSPEPTPKPYTRTQEDVKTLVKRMNPACRAVFAKFLERQKQREMKSPNLAELAAKKAGGGRPKQVKREHMARINFIWEKLDKKYKKSWTATVAHRAVNKVIKGELPFTFEELRGANPNLASKMIEFKKRVPAARLGCGIKADSIVLPRDAPPIRFDSDSSDSEERILHQDHMRLRIKRQVRNIVGPYRNIPLVNDMCVKMEKIDFDTHEMFPLGFESSSDDEDDLRYRGPVSPVHPSSMNSIHEVKDKEMELYLKRKRLRLERHELMRTAQVNAPILQAVRNHPQSVGSALLQRMEKTPIPSELIPAPVRRCCQVENKQRCERACLPSSNHCSLHVLYNVNQKLFQFCTHPQFCRRPVLAIDAMLWDGKCKLHRDPRVDKYGEYPVYSDLEQQYDSDESVSTSRTPSDIEEEEIDEEEQGEGEEEEEDDDRSTGTP